MYDWGISLFILKEQQENSSFYNMYDVNHDKLCLHLFFIRRA